jgi:hypothetical protein
VNARNGGSSGLGAPPAEWSRTSDQLPQPADEADRQDVIWQAFVGHFAWYDRKATVARHGYIVLRLIAITAAAAVTVLAAMGAPALLTASIGAVIVVVEGALQLFQFHTNWINYRRCAEEMRQQAILYVARAKPYDGADRRDLLAAAMHDLVTTEGVNWATAARRAAAKPGGDASDSDG